MTYCYLYIGNDTPEIDRTWRGHGVTHDLDESVSLGNPTSHSESVCKTQKHNQTKK